MEVAEPDYWGSEKNLRLENIFILKHVYGCGPWTDNSLIEENLEF